MIGNVHYWRRIFTSAFAVEVEALRHAVLERLLPTFEGLDAEADVTAQAEYERLGQRWSWEDPGVDMSDAATLAHGAGLDFHERVSGVRQGLLNLAAAGLYHLYEQQASSFVQRELITLHEEHDPEFMTKLLEPGQTTRVLNARLLSAGIEITALPSYRKLEELRLVANVVKHRSGDSAGRLYVLRSGLFVPPGLGPAPRRGGAPCCSRDGAASSPELCPRPVSGAPPEAYGARRRGREEPARWSHAAPIGCGRRPHTGRRRSDGRALRER